MGGPEFEIGGFQEAEVLEDQEVEIVHARLEDLCYLPPETSEEELGERRLDATLISSAEFLLMHAQALRLVYRHALGNLNPEANSLGIEVEVCTERRTDDQQCDSLVKLADMLGQKEANPLTAILIALEGLRTRGVGARSEDDIDSVHLLFEYYLSKSLLEKEPVQVRIAQDYKLVHLFESDFIPRLEREVRRLRRIKHPDMESSHVWEVLTILKGIVEKARINSQSLFPLVRPFQENYGTSEAGEGRSTDDDEPENRGFDLIDTSNVIETRRGRLFQLIRGLGEAMQGSLFQNAHDEAASLVTEPFSSHKEPFLHEVAPLNSSDRNPFDLFGGDELTPGSQAFLEDFLSQVGGQMEIIAPVGDLMVWWTDGTLSVFITFGETSTKVTSGWGETQRIGDLETALDSTYRRNSFGEDDWAQVA